MSERIELYLESVAAWNRGDLEWYRERVTEDGQVRALPGFPGIDEVYYGWEGWKEFWAAWREAWERVTIEADRVEDLGEEGVRAVVTMDGVGRESGAAVTVVAVHLTGFDERNLVNSSMAFWPDEAKARWPGFEV